MSRLLTIVFLFLIACITTDSNKNPLEISGIYIGTSDTVQSIMNAIKKTSANAVVIDVKNDSGEITCNLDVSCQKNIYISDIRNLIKALKQKGIYTIARIVAFKDPTAAKLMPELAVKNKNGSILKDKVEL